MRIELCEPNHGVISARTTGDRVWRRAPGAMAVALEPLAVDAALADESMPMIAERSSRRELPKSSASQRIRRTVDASHAATASASIDDSSDAALLRSLAEKLDLLHEQQRQLRRLLDQAGRLRVDGANS